MSLERFKGIRYPLVNDPLGFFFPQGGVNQIKSDILQILLTNKYERVMENDFGASLNELLFEQATPAIIDLARNKIINAINAYDPRVTIEQIYVSTDPPDSVLNPDDNLTEKDHVLYINIKFIDPENITEVQELRLELPLGGAG